MGKKSVAALSIVPRMPGAAIPEPADLTPAEVALWRDVVASKPAEWFGLDNAPILVEYVRAVATCGVLDAEVKKALVDGPDTARRVLEMRDKESKRVMLLATKLRLTQQSRYTPQAASTAAKKANGARPWHAGS